MDAGIDVILALIVGIVAWCVASEGAWGAAAVFVSVLLSGLLAMNFFEPVADFLQGSVAPSWHHRWDVIALVGLFGLFVFGFRAASEYLVPTFIAVHPRVYDPLRWTFAVLTGYVTMAFLLTALHTAPLPREFLGFKPERNNFFGVRAPDREWLGFTQYVSENSLRSGSSGRIFDGPVVKLRDRSQILPTFPIRYASRRDHMAAGLGGSSQGSGGESGLRPRGTMPRPAGGKSKTSF